MQLKTHQKTTNQKKIVGDSSLDDKLSAKVKRW